jgi:hypothetical protein
VPEVVTSTLLTLAGVLALLAALAGALIWVDGKAVAQIPSIKHRIAIGTIGVCLIGAGIWLNVHLGRKGVVPDALIGKLEKLESAVALLTSTTEAAGGEIASLQAQTDQLIDDVRLLALRTSITASASDDINCDKGRHGLQGGSMWVQPAGTRCEQTINSALTIDIVVPLPNTGPELAKALTPLGIPVNINPTKGPTSGRADNFLAIVFPDETPFGLICQVRNIGFKTSKLTLGAAMPSSTFRRLTGASSPAYAIQVGVPLSTFVTGGEKLSVEHWDQICDPDGTQETFEELLETMSAKFDRRPPSR